MLHQNCAISSDSFGFGFGHVHESCRFEDARSIRIPSVVIKILKKLPIYQNKVKLDPYEGNFR